MKKIWISITLAFLISGCSFLKLSKDKKDTYFTVKKYKKTFDKELHSKKKFEEQVRIELKDLDYLKLDSLNKDDFYIKKSFLLTKPYKNIRDIENDNNYIKNYKSVDVFVYQDNKALVVSSGEDNNCLGVNLDLLEVKENNLTIRGLQATSYDIQPPTVFEEEPPPVAVQPFPVK